MPRQTFPTRASSSIARSCCSPSAVSTRPHADIERALQLRAERRQRAERCRRSSPSSRTTRTGRSAGRPEGRRGGPEVGHRADRAVLRAAGAVRPGGRAGERREGRRARAAAMRWPGPGSPSSTRRSATSTRASPPPRRPSRSSPNLARTQTVLGFAYLTQVKTTEARAAFEKAITLDQADPLPRLGLGLAKIRDGESRRGRPRHRDRREPRPEQLARAQLSRQDLLRGEARPARRARVQRSRRARPEGSDAVVLRRDRQADDQPPGRGAAGDGDRRSSSTTTARSTGRELLLDSDKASRSASLARIYTDLGFQQLALVEGWKSVNADPTNFSAHRFLADTYSVLPRHEIARVSELLQSQLLQPINLTPIQPRLAESNLFLISSGGPGTRVLQRIQPAVHPRRLHRAGHRAWSASTTRTAGDAVVAGHRRQGRRSASATPGSRPTGSGSTPTRRTTSSMPSSSMTSRRRRACRPNTGTGTRSRATCAQRFFDERLPPGRSGATWKPTRSGPGSGTRSRPSSIVLASVIYQDNRDTATDDQLGVTDYAAFSRHAAKALSGELHYLFRSPRFNLVDRSRLLPTSTGTPTSTVDFDIPPPDGPGPFQIQDTIERRCPACQRLRLRLFQAARRA